MRRICSMVYRVESVVHASTSKTSQSPFKANHSHALKNMPNVKPNCDATAICLLISVPF